jgi:hypothetical protein
MEVVMKALKTVVKTFVIILMKMLADFSDSGKLSSLSTEDLGDKDGHTNTVQEYDKEGNTVQEYLNNISQDSPVCHTFVNSDVAPRRKRRKIDASLLDFNENDSSDDEDLPTIFST